MKFHFTNSLFAALLPVVSTLQSTVYEEGYLESGKTTKAGAIANEVRDQQRRNLPELSFTSWDMLAGTGVECKADCDKNAECAEGLICYHTEGHFNVPGGPDTYPVPGCTGTPNLVEYCVKREQGDKIALQVGNDGYYDAGSDWNMPGSNLGECQGACFNDDNCQDGLVCFITVGPAFPWSIMRDDIVPGCVGVPKNFGGAPPNTNYGYCIKPATESTTYNAGPEYNIELTQCTFTPDGTTTIGHITCDFTGKGGLDHVISSDIYPADCSSGAAPTGVTQGDTIFTQFKDDGSAVNQETSTYQATIDLANSATVGDSDSIAFCLKTEVSDKAGNVQVWVGQKIKLDVVLDGQFSTGSTLTTTKFEGVSTEVNDAGDVTFGVGVERCDANGNAVDDTALSLGENFFLCVKGAQTTVVIKSIQELVAAKSGIADAELIKTGNENSNTFIYGTDTNMVVIATRLPAPFFAGVGDVTVLGTANIVSGGGTGRRQLSTRNMQEITASAAEESSDFSMKVRVVSDASGALAIKTTAAVFVAFFAALFV